MAQSFLLWSWFSISIFITNDWFFTSCLNLTIMAIFTIISIVSYWCCGINLFIAISIDHLYYFLIFIAFNFVIWSWLFLTWKSLNVGIDAGWPWRKRVGIKFKNWGRWFLKYDLRSHYWLLWIILQILLNNWRIKQTVWLDEWGIKPNIASLIHSIKYNSLGT